MSFQHGRGGMYRAEMIADARNNSVFGRAKRFMPSNYKTAIAELIAERGLPRELVIDTVSKALLDVYRRSMRSSTDDTIITVDKVGEVHMFVKKHIVAQVEDSAKEISLAEAQRIKLNAALGEFMQVETPELLERIPVRNASQIILQRIREAEHMFLYEQYQDRVNEMVVATILRPNDDDGFLVQLDKLEGILPAKEMSPLDKYKPQMRIRVYVAEIKKMNGRPPLAIVSRIHINLVKRLFEQEVPEIVNGLVEIKGIVRDAGNRSKVAVKSRQDGLDAVGACVGVRGARINSIVSELNGEKVDIIPWNSDPAVFVGNALSPAKPIRIDLDPNEKLAKVIVPASQLSLAIGKDGQNARLANKLTGWRIVIAKAE